MKQKERVGRRLIRILATVSVLCLIISLVEMTGHAQGEARMTASSALAESGTDVSVSLKLEENPGIWGLKLRVRYDQSVLTLTSVTTGSVFEESELMLSEKLSADPFVVLASANQLKNKTADGTIITLNFSVNSGAEHETYPVSVEVVQANNVDGKDLTIQVENGTVSVVDCVHRNKTWELTKKAECEKAGQETFTCQKCRETFGTREVAALGHKNTEVKNAVAATENTEGYTGDIYCRDCKDLIKKGETIARLEKETPAETKPAETTATETTATETTATETTATETTATETTATETTATETTATETTAEADNTEAVENTEGTAGEPENKPGGTEPVEEPIDSMTMWLIVIALAGGLVVAAAAILCIPRTRRGKK